MKTANEMFEELEYIKEKEDNNYIIFEKGSSQRNRIIFSKNTKRICGIYIDEDYEFNEPLDMNIQELQAINKKVEELGWEK